jgi:hypothetical protein
MGVRESPFAQSARVARSDQAALRAVHVTGGLEGQRRVRVGAARAHLGRDPDRLHQLLFVGALAQRGRRVASDAVRALRDVGDGGCDQLLRLRVQRAVGEHPPAELLEGVVDVGGELLAPLRDLRAGRGVDRRVRHVVASCAAGYVIVPSRATAANGVKRCAEVRPVELM